MPRKLVALLTIPPFIAALATTFCLLGYYCVHLMGIPTQLGLPLGIRIVGAGLVLAGLALLGWVCRYRRPDEVLVSTYLTVCRALSGKWRQPAPQRTEGLVVRGPQRLVRHPMYLAVFVMVIGWWLVLDYSLVLFMAMFLLLWFNLVVIPVEERELRALFGEEYEAYARRVPRFFPWRRARAD